MAAYDNLRAVIAANVYQNNNNEVTADMVKAAMNAMVASLGAEFQFGGEAKPTDAGPGTPDYKVAYLASTPGTYSNFGGITLADGEVAILKWDGETWAKETTDIASATQAKSNTYKVEQLAVNIKGTDTIIASGTPTSSSTPSARLSADFPLKSGVPYTLRCVFDSAAASGSSARVYLLRAGTTTGAIAQVTVYAATWNTIRTADFSVAEDGMYYLVFRHLGTAPGVSLTAAVDNPLYTNIGGAIENYRVKAGAFPIGDLLVGKSRSDDGTPVTNAYRLCTAIYRLAMPHFRISCNYVDGYTYYLYVKRGGAFSAVVSNVAEDKDFYLFCDEFYITVRALNGRAVTDADVAACGLSITLYDDTFSLVPDVNAEVNSLRKLMLEDFIANEQFTPTSTSSIHSVSPNFFMKHGREYTMRAQWDAQPTSDAQVNIWVYKAEQTTGNIGRIILRGGEDWQGERLVKIVPQDDGLYYIGYRVISGGAQEETISVSIDNPLISQPAESEEILPGYYFPYIEERAAAAKREMAKCGAGSIAMFLITDTHHPQNYGLSGKMLRFLNERLQVHRTLYGGDVCPSLTSLWGGSAGTAEDGIALADNAVSQLLSNARGRIYRVKGNHDYSLANYTYWVSGTTYKVGDIRVWAASNTGGVGDNYAYRCIEANSDDSFDINKWERVGDGGFQLSQIESQRLILADAEAAGDCVFPDGSMANYYYFDIPRSKMRVICWDCCDSDDGFRGISDVHQNISDAQFKWMANAILSTPTGYNIVSFGHIPTYLNQSIGAAAYQTATWTIAKRNLYAAVNGRGTFTIGGETYDFANLTAKIIIEIAGHTHADCITKLSGLFGISVAGDWWSDNLKYSPVYYHFGLSSLAARVGGTTQEQAFDLVLLDPANDYIKFIRFGAGIDRWLNLGVLSVSAGDTLQVAPSLTGELEYYVYDADLRAQDADGKYRPTSTRASIDENGVVTAISSGDVVVMAYDTTNRIVEVFGITIE